MREGRHEFKGPSRSSLSSTILTLLGGIDSTKKRLSCRKKIENGSQKPEQERSNSA